MSPATACSTWSDRWRTCPPARVGRSSGGGQRPVTGPCTRKNPDGMLDVDQIGPGRRPDAARSRKTSPAARSTRISLAGLHPAKRTPGDGAFDVPGRAAALRISEVALVGNRAARSSSLNTLMTAGSMSSKPSGCALARAWSAAWPRGLFLASAQDAHVIQIEHRWSSGDQATAGRYLP